MFYAILVVLLIQAATLGISDDEAYYWVLAQSPMLGFSYHPGGVVWSIWISEKLFGFLPWRELVVRLPAIAMISGMLFEFRSMAGKDRDGRLDWILAAGGIWAVSWLMVPDPLLMLGLVLALRGVLDERPYRLAIGLGLVLLAKFSGILVVASAFWVVRNNRKLLTAVLVGSLAGLLPTILWNVWTDFQPLRFQVLQRHQGSHPSPGRWLGFWATQLVLVGPLFFWGLWSLIRSRKSLAEKAFLWPPLIIFGLQPLLAPFKLHWGLPVWLVVMVWLLRDRTSMPTGIVRAQKVIGWGVYAFLGFAFQYPVLTQWGSPLLDPSSDLRGWSQLAPFVQEKLGVKALDLHVVGSRYQTASQAAFHWPAPSRVTLFPKRGTEILEWPDLAPGRFLYVADERYSDPPTVPWANCRNLGRVDQTVANVRGKWIQVWDCLPIGQSFDQVVSNPDKSG